MSSQTTPTTPAPAAAPSAAPASPAPSAPASKPSFDDKYDAALKSLPDGDRKHSDTSATAPTPTQGTAAPASGSPSAAAKRLLKLKIDGRDEDFDIDAEYGDETKRKSFGEIIQKGRNYDRAIERARAEVAQATRRAWNEFLNSENFDLIEDKSRASGWKLVPRPNTTGQAPVTTPAPQDTDPLTTEERTLKAKIAAADVVDPADLDRLSEVRALLAEKRGAEAAYKRWKDEQAKAARDAEVKDAEVKGRAALTSEVESLIAARVTSFDGPDKDRRLSRVKAQAIAAAEATARTLERHDPQGWQKLVAAAQAVVKEEADDLDLRAKWQRDTLATPPATPPAAPIVGAAPGGAGRSTKKTFDEAYDEALKAL